MDLYDIIQQPGYRQLFLASTGAAVGALRELCAWYNDRRSFDRVLDVGVPASGAAFGLEVSAQTQAPLAGLYSVEAIADATAATLGYLAVSRLVGDVMGSSGWLSIKKIDLVNARYRRSDEIERRIERAHEMETEKRCERLRKKREKMMKLQKGEED